MEEGGEQRASEEEREKKDSDVLFPRYNTLTIRGGEGRAGGQAGFDCLKGEEKMTYGGTA